MYNKNIAITGSTIEKTTKYDQFREDKIRMELYRRILSLLAADTIVMLRDADKCPDIILSAVIPETPYPAGADKLYCALYDDLLKQAGNRETLSEKDSLQEVLTSSHIVCYYEDTSDEIGQVRALGIPYTNIRKMI